MLLWEKVKDFGAGRQWAQRELEECFALVRGGVAFPGKQSGFGVVAGLRIEAAGGRVELHVLDHVEDSDLGGLLRQCAGLTARFSAIYEKGQSFRWIGEAAHTGAGRLVADLNRDRPRHRLCLGSTAIRDMTDPYSYMVALLRGMLETKHETLFLHGSTLAERLAQIGPGQDLTDLALGDHPAIESLAFVAQELQDRGRCGLHRGQKYLQPVPVDPMKYCG